MMGCQCHNVNADVTHSIDGDLLANYFWMSVMHCGKFGVILIQTVAYWQDMYIRVKRSKTTYFIRCKPSDKILDIKQKLQELVDQPANNQRLILPVTGEVLEDSKTLADQKVQ